MKSKMAGDSGETCRRMILAPYQAALDMNVEHSTHGTRVVLGLNSPGHVMSVSLFPIRQVFELGLDAQLEDLDLMDSHCEEWLSCISSMLGRAMISLSMALGVVDGCRQCGEGVGLTFQVRSGLMRHF